MTNLPRLTIITPVFNAAETLEECILSVANQNYSEIEHWFIDGLSTDSSLEVIKKYTLQFPHIKYVSEKDKGIYDAMNKGIDLANGEWLYFLGADDVVFPDSLRRIADELEINNVDLLYGKIREIGKRDRVFGQEFNVNRLTPEMLLSPFIHLFVHHQGVFIRKKLFKKHGYYDLRYKIGADIHFFIKAIGDTSVKKAFLNEYIAYVGTNGLSSNEDDLVISEEFPDLIRKHLNILIDKRMYYRNLSKYYFDRIYRQQLWEGLVGIMRLARKTHDYPFYIKNTAYWIKRRITDKKYAYSYCV